MKKPTLALVLTLAAAVALAGDVVKRGAPLSDAKPIALATVLETPGDYTEKPVIVEGLIEESCTRKGCWMQLVAEPGKPGVRVTFKDYGFFIPLKSKGMKALVEGVATVKTLTRQEADHLAEEGAKIVRNEDGTAREVSFVASGVELRKPAL